jgi:sugar O-acyltransferase (sialic acid O-acetyltransferase NeuD family)
VIYEASTLSKYKITGYLDKELKEFNPFNLSYHGDDSCSNINMLKSKYQFIVSIGDNKIRRRIFEALVSNKVNLINVIDQSVIISESLNIGRGNFISKNVSINSQVSIGDGCIINTGAIIEHEVVIKNYTHIAPGAILCGNVTIGLESLIGAGSIVKPNTRIGDNVIVGAGSTVLNNIMDNEIWAGNPARFIRNNE